MYRKFIVAFVAIAAVSVGLVAPMAGASAPTRANPQKVCQAVASQPDSPKQELKAIRLARSGNVAALKQALVAMEKAAQKAVKTGKSAPIETKTYNANLTKVFAFAYEECADQQVEVASSDASCDGFPATLDTGTFGVKITNQGADDQFFGVLTVADDDSRSPQEIVDALYATPDGQEPEGISFLTGADAPKGASGYAFGTLEAGRYVFVCGNETAAIGSGEFTVA